MKNNPKVSVIVPVYNVEKYLRQCIDSIVVQSLVDIEMIIVNDGSTDGSLAIMKEYADKDDRITIIDKPNEGYGKSVNCGLDKASGKYIGIVESDDWIEPMMYEVLYGQAEKHDADVVKARFIPFDDKTGEDKSVSLFPLPSDGVVNPREKPVVFMMLPSIWSGIYNRKFLVEQKIRFLESPGASYQDIGFSFKVWAMAERVFLTQTPLLHYRLHAEQSIRNKDKAFCVCDEFKEIDRYMKDKAELSRKLEQIYNRVKYGFYMWNYICLEGETRADFAKVFVEEFAPVLKRGTLDFGTTSKDRVDLETIIYPNSVWVKCKYLALKVFRCLIRTHIHNGHKEIRLWFGRVTIRKTPLIFKGMK